MMDCFEEAIKELKDTIFKSRIDSAFFSKKILSILDYNNVKFTASVPFERFPQLKDMIEHRKCWRSIDGDWSYF